MDRLTGDFITSIEIGHLNRLGTVMCNASLPIFCTVQPNKERGQSFVRSGGQLGAFKGKGRGGQKSGLTSF